MKKRYTALFLSALLTMSSGCTVCADEFETEAETIMPEAAAETAATEPAVKPTAESAPETTAAETASETEASETAASESETEASAVTAQETEMQETEMQETEMQETEMPETEMPETEMPDAAAAESEARETSTAHKKANAHKTRTDKDRKTEKRTGDGDGAYGELYLAVHGYPAQTLTENEAAVYRYLRDELRLSKAAACGVMANIYCESGFSTLVIGDGGTSLGLCQWHAQRCGSLIGWCGANGYDYRSAEGQLHYLGAELTNGYRAVLDYLMQVPDTEEGAYKAAYHYCMYYENPDNTAVRADARGQLARKRYFSSDLDRMQGERQISEDEKLRKMNVKYKNTNPEAASNEEMF